MTDTQKFISIPIQFHCEGMMRIIQQLISDNMKAGNIKGELPTLLTEYAKFYHNRLNGITVIDATGQVIERSTERSADTTA